MSEEIDQADAVRALSEIDRRREQVIRRTVLHGWFWWAYAVLFVVLAASVESGRTLLMEIGIAVFVAGSIVIDLPVRRSVRAAAPRRGLAGHGAARRTLLGLASFVAVLMGVAVATGFSLKAAGVPYPGTFAAAVAGVLFATGGPLLVRYEAAIQVHESRGQV